MERERSCMLPSPLSTQILQCTIHSEADVWGGGGALFNFTWGVGVNIQEVTKVILS